MDNGEIRYRLVASDGTAYVRTEASADSGWQNSHYHKKVFETYILQKGWAAFAELQGGELRLWIMRPGDVYTTSQGVSHNMYLAPHAITHVIKHGDGEDQDWFADPVLDGMTKRLSESEIRARTEFKET